MEWLWFLLIGAVAGWLTGLIMKGRGYGLLGNILIGVVGGFVGGHLFDWLNIYVGSGFGGSLLTAVFGAVVLVSLVNILAPRR